MHQYALCPNESLNLSGDSETAASGLATDVTLNERDGAALFVSPSTPSMCNENQRLVQIKPSSLT